MGNKEMMHQLMQMVQTMNENMIEMKNEIKDFRKEVNERFDRLEQHINDDVVALLK